MSKGDQTRATILKQALNLTSEVGLEALTVGVLAKRVGMSKSGLYAHFDSKEDLQCQVLDFAADRFVELVLSRAFKQPRGIPRLRALYDLWLRWSTEGLSGGCPFIAAATEFDDRPGQVRDRVTKHLSDTVQTISRAARIAVEEGHFRDDVDVEQFAFEFWSILMGYHHYARLLQRDDAQTRSDAAFDGLIRNSERT